MTETPEAVIQPELLALLRCPRTSAPLRLASSEEVQRINERIAAGNCFDANGEAVKDPIEAGLVNEPAQWCYAIRDAIPTLIPDEAIALE